MGISNEIKTLQQDIEKICAERKLILQRISELRSLVDRKKKEEDELGKAREEELKLLQELGL
jgi:septal ring factor EnvC (AmiA/AmiB activator)